jgi:hypothetical protein
VKALGEKFSKGILLPDCNIQFPVEVSAFRIRTAVSGWKTGSTSKSTYISK